MSLFVFLLAKQGDYPTKQELLLRICYYLVLESYF